MNKTSRTKNRELQNPRQPRTREQINTGNCRLIDQNDQIKENNCEYRKGRRRNFVESSSTRLVDHAVQVETQGLGCCLHLQAAPRPKHESRELRHDVLIICGIQRILRYLVDAVPKFWASELPSNASSSCQLRGKQLSRIKSSRNS